MAAPDIFSGIEPRKVLAEDLFRAIALDRSAPAFQLTTLPSGSSMTMA